MQSSVSAPASEPSSDQPKLGERGDAIVEADFLDDPAVDKLAENAGWDRKLLGIEFQCLSELDLDFDVSSLTSRRLRSTSSSRS